jgi:hypothetical protein
VDPRKIPILQPRLRIMANNKPFKTRLPYAPLQKLVSTYGPHTYLKLVLNLSSSISFRCLPFLFPCFSVWVSFLFPSRPWLWRILSRRTQLHQQRLWRRRRAIEAPEPPPAIAPDPPYSSHGPVLSFSSTLFSRPSLSPVFLVRTTSGLHTGLTSG